MRHEPHRLDRRDITYLTHEKRSPFPQLRGNEGGRPDALPPGRAAHAANGEPRGYGDGSAYSNEPQPGQTSVFGSSSDCGPGSAFHRMHKSEFDIKGCQSNTLGV